MYAVLMLGPVHRGILGDRGEIEWPELALTGQDSAVLSSDFKEVLATKANDLIQSALWQQMLAAVQKGATEASTTELVIASTTRSADRSFGATGECRGATTDRRRRPLQRS